MRAAQSSRRIVILILLSGAVASGFSQTHDEHSPGFAPTLRRVIRAGRERFRPIKSFRVEMRPGREYWYESEEGLPGASICRIYEHPELIYVCEWKNQKAGAATTHAELVKRVESALGDRWTRADAKSRGVTRFEAKVAEPGIAVEIVEVGKGPAVKIIVYAPAT
jgi:hypothetical protein